MASNPNPDRITDAFWEILWEAVRAALGSDVALGGIYAAKCRYHDTRKRNQRVCPGNYSIRLADDLAGPDDKAAAIDWTFRSAQRGDHSHIIRITKRLLAAYDDPDDPRVGPHVTAEFYGTTNGRDVVGRLHGRSATSDDSHRWHIHYASHRRYVGNRAVARAVLSVVTGESLATWKAREYGSTVVPVPAGSPLLRRQPMSTGSRVRQLQRALNEVIAAGLKIDGAYGLRTEATVEAFQRHTDLAADGIYGPNTASALRTALEEDMAVEVDLIGSRVKMADDDGNRWSFGTILDKDSITANAALGYAAGGGWQTRTEVVPMLRALTAKVAGEDVAKAVEELGAEFARHQAALDARLDAAAAERAALAELVQRGNSGELEAAEVVRLMGELLATAAVEPAGDES